MFKRNKRICFNFKLLFAKILCANCLLSLFNINKNTIVYFSLFKVSLSLTLKIKPITKNLNAQNN